ncbi:lanthionine synthetase C family protein [Streptomyces sp. NPDC059009]|uniref:lanthionine synthetase C family protein n=1 Tax=Streptomyces sp. NPDC059009 TaxID=3346694 RepID=UPI0036C938A6
MDRDQHRAVRNTPVVQGEGSPHHRLAEERARSDVQRLRARARHIADDVADRLADPAFVDRHLTATPKLEGSLLTNGAAGTALLLAEAGHAQGAYREQTRAHLGLWAQRLRAAPARIGLFSGLAGLGFACGAASSADDDTYAHLRGQVRAAVLAATPGLSTAIGRRIDGTGTALTMVDHDVVYGLTGLGVYLLAEAPDSRALAQVTDTLIRLSATREVTGHRIPAWATRRVDDGTESGLLNLGLAHGLAGSLAFLSLALLVGAERPGQRQAVHDMAAWLLNERRDGPDGAAWWPRTLRLDATGAATVTDPPTQLAWCYGTLSVCTALRLAGQAGERPDWVRDAKRDLIRAFDDLSGADVTASHLCHGWAGLLQITSRTRDGHPGDDELTGLTHTLAARVLNSYDAQAPFGFRTDLGLPHGPQNEPGFLTGAAGNALALHAYGHDQLPATVWDAALLLAPPRAGGPLPSR